MTFLFFKSNLYISDVFFVVVSEIVISFFVIKNRTVDEAFFNQCV